MKQMAALPYMLFGWSSRSCGTVQFDSGCAQWCAPVVLAAEAQDVDLPVATTSLSLPL